MSASTSIAMSTLTPGAVSTAAATANSAFTTTSSQQATTNACPAQTTTTLTTANSAAPAASHASAATGGTTQSGRSPSWLQKGKAMLSLCGSAIKFVVAVLGIWAMYMAWKGLKLQQWAARNDALQSCKALESRSEYCNKTLEAGVQPLPTWKRNAPVSKDPVGYLIFGTVPFWSPAGLAASCVVTFTALILASIKARPSMQPFPPMISNVRLALLDFVWSPYRGPEPGALLIAQPWTALSGELRVIASILQGMGKIGRKENSLDTEASDNNDSSSKKGHLIGIFYDTDSEEDSDQLIRPPKDRTDDDELANLSDDARFDEGSASESLSMEILGEDANYTDEDLASCELGWPSSQDLDACCATFETFRMTPVFAIFPGYWCHPAVRLQHVSTAALLQFIQRSLGGTSRGMQRLPQVVQDLVSRVGAESERRPASDIYEDDVNTMQLRRDHRRPQPKLCNVLIELLLRDDELQCALSPKDQWNGIAEVNPLPPNPSLDLENDQSSGFQIPLSLVEFMSSDSVDLETASQGGALARPPRTSGMKRKKWFRRLWSAVRRRSDDETVTKYPDQSLLAVRSSMHSDG